MLSHGLLMDRCRKRKHILVSHTGCFNLHNNDRTFPLPAAISPPEKFLLFYIQYTICSALPATGILWYKYLRRNIFELGIVQFRIKSFLRKQLLMISLLDNIAVFHDKDQVRILNR